ncbi:MAG: DNA mismatch repair protein MutH [Candidatus Anaerobiospirillum merdipullorum]|uniref:DNA mismatch repair protein MutH n=1 Tax=Candidatus Anaerobiospirillum merdipullorum TaxID=2838450 RepID=A0A9E2KQP2_9GAMM|nr:DNA mismatch repair protein MutH [Candidatus Anaerobiospirillum merdipullorum]
MSSFFANVSHLPEPHTLDELRQRLELICGKTISELAGALNLSIPQGNTHSKGYTGGLIELYLGAAAPNLGAPDFPFLGIELKTVPVDELFTPIESTFICHAPIKDIRGLDFYHSTLYAKIRLTLYVFVLTAKKMPIRQRRVVDYLLYQMPPADLLQVKADYDELMELITQGQGKQITARIGTLVQLRPKAPNGQRLTAIVDEDGAVSTTRPRGFYMRRSYMAKICKLVATRHQLPLQLAPADN